MAHDVRQLVGGPDEDRRSSLTDQPLAAIGALVSSIDVIPYTQWRKRQRAAGATSGAH